MPSLHLKTAMETFHDKAVSLSMCFIKEGFSLHRARLCDSLIFESLLSFVMSRASLITLAFSGLLSSLLTTSSTDRIPSFCTTSLHAWLQKMSPLWANAFLVLDWYKLLQLGFFALFIFRMCTAVRRLYFHPLSKYPGPWLWAISKLPDTYNRAIGLQMLRVAELHQRYGPVVRIAPNELSYSVEDAWQDIYAKSGSRNAQLPKDPFQFFRPPGGKNSMIQEPDDDEHHRMRRVFAHGFSEKALRNQEPVMNQSFDLLIKRLHENSGNPTDMNEWYQRVTFDVIGNITLGECFNCLEESNTHIWAKTILYFLWLQTILGLSLKFWPMAKIILFLTKPFAGKVLAKHENFVKSKVQRRLALKSAQQDFMRYAHETYGTPQGLTFQEICEQAGLLIIAGSITTATCMAGVTYLLLSNPSVLAKITHLVRTQFHSESEINSVTVNKLDYLLAIINEALRLYPPVTGSFARFTPPEGCFIAGDYVPGNTSVAVNQWAASRGSANFVRPNEFLPGRWMGEPEFETDKRKAVQPFSVGPRNCLGRNLAYMEVKIVLARVLWNFDMELCEESRGWMERQRYWAIADRPELMVKLTPVVRD